MSEATDLRQAALDAAHTYTAHTLGCRNCHAGLACERALELATAKRDAFRTFRESVGA